MSKMLKKWQQWALAPALSLMATASAFADPPSTPASDPAAKATFGNFMTNIQNLSFDTLQVIIAILVVVGITFVVMGALKLKQNHDQPNQGHAAKGFITLIVGIVLLMPITMTKILRNTLDNGLISSTASTFDVGDEGVTLDRTSKTKTGPQSN